MLIKFALASLLMGCGRSDMPEDTILNPCEGKCQIQEVTISEVSLEPVDNGTQRGYIIKAKITNHTDERLEGEPNFVFFANKKPQSVSGEGICGDIIANSTCSYENFVWERERPIDFSVSMECYYYTLSNN